MQHLHKQLQYHLRASPRVCLCAARTCVVWVDFSLRREVLVHKHVGVQEETWSTGSCWQKGKESQNRSRRRRRTGWNRAGEEEWSHDPSAGLVGKCSCLFSATEVEQHTVETICFKLFNVMLVLKTACIFDFMWSVIINSIIISLFEFDLMRYIFLIRGNGPTRKGFSSSPQEASTSGQDTWCKTWGPWCLIQKQVSAVCHSYACVLFHTNTRADTCWIIYFA